MPIHRYPAYVPVALTDRTWPDKVITARPAGALSTCVTATRH